MNVRVMENKLQSETLHSAESVRVALSGVSESEAVPALLEIAENEEQKRRGVIMKGGVLSIVFFILFLASGISLLVFQLPNKFIWQITFYALPYAFFILLATGYRSTRKIVQKQQNAVAALLLCPQEPRFLPQLVDGLHTPKTQEWKALLYPALTAALWDATHDDLSFRLDAPRREVLRAFVTYPYVVMAQRKQRIRVPSPFDDATADLTVAALKALVSVGDRKTVNLLRRIVATEDLERNETVGRDAAHEFLPILQKRIDETEKIFEYLRTLADKTPRASYTAIVDYVNTFAPQEVHPILVEFLAEQNRRTARTRWLSCLGLLAAFTTLALACFALIGYPIFLGASIVIFAPLISHWLKALWRPESEAQAGKIVYELAKRSGDDTRVIPVLLRAGQKRLNRKQADAVKKAVTRLLSLLRAGDAALVPPLLRGPLRAWLTMPRGVLGRAAKNRAIIALDALAVIGDTASLRRVKAVARYAETATRGDTLRQTAERCVEALKLRKPLA